MPRPRLTDWPLLRQILRRADGTGAEAMSPRTRRLRARVGLRLAVERA